MSAAAWIGVAALGGAGATARLLLDGAVSARVPGGFPAGTLAVNLLGAALLGLLAGLALPEEGLTLLGTALVGSFTTFSTWIHETHRLAEDGDLVRAVANLVVSVALGLGAVLAGRLIGGLL